MGFDLGLSLGLGFFVVLLYGLTLPALYGISIFPFLELTLIVLG